MGNPIFLSSIALVLGFLSVLGSIAIWFMKKGPDPESLAHGERFGIFVGLWAPTFFALAAYLRTLGEA
jgi:hypothetical protein